MPFDATMKSELDRAAEGIGDRVVAWRRHLHAHPELSNREVETERYVAEQLRSMGIADVRTGVGRHGVVGMIDGAGEGPAVALRADMDALPVQEDTGLPFASTAEGVMHACGHDTHMAMLLGAAALLVERRDRFSGRVKLIFQGAEEGAPSGEQGGAPFMIEHGVLDDPKVDAILGMHVVPMLPTGRVGVCPGAAMASVDRFRITLTGRQTHGALPNLGVDPVTAASQIVTALQTIASREVDPRDAVVVSVGKFEAPGRWNIIHDTVVLEGTVRTHKTAVRDFVGERMVEIVEGVARAMRVKSYIQFERLNPPLQNDPQLCRAMRPALDMVFGAENVSDAAPWMAGEDFAHYTVRVPALYLFLGANSPNNADPAMLHTPRLNIDEDALLFGVKTHVAMALRFLAGE